LKNVFNHVVLLVVHWWYNCFVSIRQVAAPRTDTYWTALCRNY